jgi:hypothetical protein
MLLNHRESLRESDRYDSVTFGLDLWVALWIRHSATSWSGTA